MAELPKTVWHRIRRTSAGGNSKSREHPDVNLLTAFIEQSLTKAEHERVMSHLSECVHCREQVSLAAAAATDTTAQSPAAAPRRSARQVWRVLRWSALGASLTAFLVIVVLHHPESNTLRTATPAFEARPERAEANRAEANKVTDKSAGAATNRKSTVTESPLPSARSAASHRAEVASGKEKAAPRAIPQSLDAEKKSDTPASASAALGAGLRQRAKREPAATALTAQSISALVPESKTKDVNATAVASDGRSTNTAAAAPPPAKQEAGLAGPRAQKAAEGQGRVLSRAKIAEDEIAQARGRPATAESSNALVAKSGVVGGAPQVAHRDDERKAALKPVPALETPAFKPAARWTISSSGKLRRSFDAGRTWQELEVSPNVSFRAIAVVGAEVWAGGSAGALYHSSDNGVSWTRINLSSDRAVTETITGITFSDLRHGAITTSAGETWITTDGGRSWTRQQ